MQTQKLYASDAGALDIFGKNIAISGNTLIVEKQDLARTNAAGAVYVFERVVDGTWQQTQKLTPKDSHSEQLFGQGLTTDGKRIIVGARWDDGTAREAGAAYVFERTANGWVERRKLIASDAPVGGNGGVFPLLHEGQVILGAPVLGSGQSTRSTVIPPAAGALYFFNLDDPSVSQPNTTASSQILADDDLREQDWLHEPLFVSPSGLNTTSLMLTRELLGGNQQTFQQGTHTIQAAAGYEIHTGHLLQRGGTFVPSTQGQIGTVTFSWDAKRIGNRDATLRPMVEQGGNFYVADPVNVVASDNWTTFSTFALSSTDFQQVSSTGFSPGAPDFSKEGGAITFGYLTSDSSLLFDPQTMSWGIDNFSVTVSSEVVVQPVDEATGEQPVTLKFTQVTSPGVTTVSSLSEAATPDTGFEVLGTYYEVKSTATFSGPVDVSFQYDESQILPNHTEDELQLMHREDTNNDGVVDYRDEWVDRTDRTREFDTEIPGEVTFGIDTVNDVIYGLVSSLSPFAIFVPNGPATAISGGPYLVDEGGSVMLDGSASEDPENDIRVYEWDFDYDGLSFDVDAHGVSVLFDASNLDGPADRTVALRVVDTANNVSLTTTTLTVNNVAPTVAADNATVTVSEGATANNSGMFGDAGADTVALSTSVGTVLDNGNGTWSWSFNTSDGPDQGQTVTVTATDSDGALTSTTFDLVITNVAPMAGVVGPSSAVRGQTGTFIFTASDVSPADQAGDFTFTIDWDGDGTVDHTETGLAPLTLDHVYPQTGSYTIKATATDKDGDASVVATHTLTVSVVELQADPGDPMKTALVVGGGAGDDNIMFMPLENTGDISVSLNGDSLGTFYPTGRLIAFGQAGHDDIQVAGSIPVSAWLYGGAGHDCLKGGAGHDNLLGGDGDDLLVGGQGRDFLIGGRGADRLVGNADEDILIAGTTDFDAHDAALAAILSEWTSSRSYAQRTVNITGGSGAATERLNGNYFLNTSVANGLITVYDDNAKDMLTGASGQDWFFANLFLDNDDDADQKDKITDLSANEFALDLDFIGIE